MLDFDAQQSQQQDQQQQQPAAPAPVGVPPAIVAGAPDLATAIAKAYMTHLTANQPPPTAAVQQQAADKQAAAQPVDTSAKPAAMQSTPQNGPQPPQGGGKFGSTVDAIEGGLADAAHAKDTKGGWLTGISNTLNARQQRLAQQQKDQQLIAKTQAETILLHRNIYRQDQEIREGAYTANQKYIDTMQVNHDIQTDVSDAQLREKMKDPNFAATHFVRATTETPVTGPDGQPKKDKEGLPIMTPSYAIVTRATKDGKPDDHTVTPEMSADAQRLIGSKLPPGAKLTTDQFTALSGQIDLARNAVNILTKSSGKELTQDQLKTIGPALNDPTIQAAISHVPGSPYAGMVQYQNNADAHIEQLQQQQQQAMAAKDQNAYDKATASIKEFQDEKAKVNQFASQVISPKEIDEYNKQAAASNGLIAEIAKDPTKIQGHAESVITAAQDTIANTKDPAVKAQAQRVLDMAKRTEELERQNKIDTAVGEQQGKDKAARVDNNPNGLTGAAFIATLPPGRANLVRSIAEGGLAVNASAFERSQAGKSNPLADDVYAAYPDFKPYLGQEWPKSYANYMINGVDHKKATAFNTVMEHAGRLFDNTTLNGVTNPTSKEFHDRNEEMSFVTRELGNAVSSGVLAQAEAQEVRDAIQTNWPSIEMKREKVREAVRLLDSKMKAMQDGFDATAPSAGITVPRLQSAAATAAHNHVLGLDQQQDQGKQGGAPSTPVLQGPKGGTNQMVSSDGKTSIWLLNNQWVTADGKPYTAGK